MQSCRGSEISWRETGAICRRPKGVGYGERVSHSYAGEETGEGAVPRSFENLCLKIIKIVHFRGVYVNFVGHFTCCFKL